MLSFKFIRSSIIFLVILAVAMLAIERFITLRSGEASCRPFKRIADNAELNKEFRFELNEFVNNEMVRQKMHGTHHRGYVAFPHSFFGQPVGWLGMLDNYPTHQRFASFVVRFDGAETGIFAPPYKITEVGVYSLRSQIMYRNVNDEWYHSGPGLVELSAEPYIICGSTYDKTGISFQNK